MTAVCSNKYLKVQLYCTVHHAAQNCIKAEIFITSQQIKKFIVHGAKTSGAPARL